VASPDTATACGSLVWRRFTSGGRCGGCGRLSWIGGTRRRSELVHIILRCSSHPLDRLDRPVLRSSRATVVDLLACRPGRHAMPAVQAHKRATKHRMTHS